MGWHLLARQSLHPSVERDRATRSSGAHDRKAFPSERRSLRDSEALSRRLVVSRAFWPRRPRRVKSWPPDSRPEPSTAKGRFSSCKSAPCAQESRHPTILNIPRGHFCVSQSAARQVDPAKGLSFRRSLSDASTGMSNRGFLSTVLAPILLLIPVMRTPTGNRFPGGPRQSCRCRRPYSR